VPDLVEALELVNKRQGALVILLVDEGVYHGVVQEPVFAQTLPPHVGDTLALVLVAAVAGVDEILREGFTP